MTQVASGGPPSVNLYFSDDIERTTVFPIARELERYLPEVRLTNDFSSNADIGVYACHSNRFFDFAMGLWDTPPNTFSAICLHDFGQAGGSNEDYWLNDSWHVFDLGLLPGPTWERFWNRAQAKGIPGPSMGVRTVGWPKFDHVDSGPERFTHSKNTLRKHLGLDDQRPVVLLACSWSDCRQLEDTLSAIDHRRFQLVVKYPHFPPPEETSPWFERLTTARAQMLLAKTLALETESLAVADDGVDLYALLGITDVVLSNGSNVMYEAVLMGKPAVSIRDWVHPSGPEGNDTAIPHMDLEGVLTGSHTLISELLNAVCSSAFQPLIAAGSDSLVRTETRGRASKLAAQAILEVYEETVVER